MARKKKHVRAERPASKPDDGGAIVPRPAKKAARPRRAARPAAAANAPGLKVPPAAAVVRMYRQGLGDCFLLAFPSRVGTPVFVLIDCGVIMGTPDAEATMRRVAEDIRAATGGHLDVLVATHEHWTNVSGFLQARDVFERMTIDEVWLPWTEDPDDLSAREFRWRRRSGLVDLSRARKLLAKKSSATSERIDAVLGSSPDVRRTTEALQLIQKWARVKRYLRPGGPPFVLPGTDDVRVYVLGPPEPRPVPEATRGITRTAEAESPGEAFFSAVRAASRADAGQAVDHAMPFDASLRVPVDAASRDPFFREKYLAAAGEEWRRIDPDWLEFAGPLTLMHEMDTNNLSLVLAFETLDGGRVLLFPADAQELNWRSWHDLNWTVRASDGSLAGVTADDLLRRTVLYKVSHHGSHNANPRTFGLEQMASPELTALLPVDEEMARQKRWAMPFPPVLERLMELTRGQVVRSDRGLPDGAPASLRARVKETGLYIDVIVPRRSRERDDSVRRIEEALRGPILDNYEGHAVARFTDAAGKPLDGVAPGGRCRLRVQITPRPPAEGVSEPVNVRDGEDAPQVAFEVAVDAGPLGVEPRRATLVAVPGGPPSRAAAFDLEVPPGHTPGPCPVYVQVFQKTQLLCVVEAGLTVQAPDGGDRP